jgi:hypothetical protein
MAMTVLSGFENAVNRFQRSLDHIPVFSGHAVVPPLDKLEEYTGLLSIVKRSRVERVVSGLDVASFSGPGYTG